MAIQRLAIPSRDRRRYLLAIREQAYVADGIANEIRATLARNGALEVVGQASSEAFARRKDEAVVFAKKIHAGYLIDGAVQIVSDVLSVTINLLDGKLGVL